MAHLFRNADNCSNQLLSSLPMEEYARLVPHLRVVRFALG